MWEKIIGYKVITWLGLILISVAMSEQLYTIVEGWDYSPSGHQIKSDIRSDLWHFCR
jgi:hypothetical protein